MNMKKKDFFSKAHRMAADDVTAVPRGCTVKCISGAVCVTWPGSGDIVLEAGESAAVPNRRGIYVRALGECEFAAAEADGRFFVTAIAARLRRKEAFSV